jgi:hypothetical protein
VGRCRWAAAQYSTGDLVQLSAGQVVQVPGCGVGGPDRQPVRAEDCLNISAEVAVFSGVPRASTGSPFTLVVVSVTPSVAKSFPSRITGDQPSAATRCRASCKSGACAVRTLTPSVT